MARYGIAIDVQRCTGCNQCVLVCKMENNVPDGVLWSRVVTPSGRPDMPTGTFPNIKMSWSTLSCQHCDEASCLEVCPTGATYRDEEYGTVLVDAEKCIGCESCIAACPYDGVRTLVDGEPSWFLDFSIGDWEAPAHVANTVEKCTMCHHRLVRGERPACIDVCAQVARYFGDLDDPESEISKALGGREYKRLLEDQGTSPKLYYLEPR